MHENIVCIKFFLVNTLPPLAFSFRNVNYEKKSLVTASLTITMHRWKDSWNVITSAAAQAFVLKQIQGGNLLTLICTINNIICGCFSYESFGCCV